jgi:hypothetical protein
VIDQGVCFNNNRFKEDNMAGRKKAVSQGSEKVKQAVEILTDAPNAGGKKPTGKRVLAVLLWLLAIACEVFAILVFTYKVIVPDDFFLYFLIGAIALDLILVVIGSFLWKSANRVDPASSKNKVKFFLWNQLGLIVAIIAFLPMIVLLLTDKKLDKKNKTIVTVVAIIALVLGGALSIDYNPVSQEDFAAKAQADAQQLGVAAPDTVLWTAWGKSYHFDPNCQTLRHTRPEDLFTGTLQEAFDAHRTDPCDFCALPKDTSLTNTQ